MKIKLLAIFLTILLAGCRENKETLLDIEFINKEILPHTSVKNQGRTQSCWAFAMASLFKSEYLKENGDTIHLSVMYTLREKYLQHFKYHYYTKGRDIIRGGSLGHTFLNIYKEFGIIPFESYNGIMKSEEKYYDHTQLIETLKNYANNAIKNKDIEKYFSKAKILLDETMGKIPQQFIFKGKEYTPESFSEYININIDDYVQLTSFTHHPFNSSFSLEVPDNWDNGMFYNITIDNLEDIVRYGLKQGYSSVWDGDISEKGFLQKQGIAIYPTSNISQEFRQIEFNSFTTTDDHMMHIIGYAYDKNGKFYYILKNSWGKVGKFNGLLYMSEDYFRAKTVSIIINRNVLPEKHV